VPGRRLRVEGRVNHRFNAISSDRSRPRDFARAKTCRGGPAPCRAEHADGKRVDPARETRRASIALATVTGNAFVLAVVLAVADDGEPFKRRGRAFAAQDKSHWLQVLAQAHLTRVPLSIAASGPLACNLPSGRKRSLTECKAKITRIQENHVHATVEKCRSIARAS